MWDGGAIMSDITAEKNDGPRPAQYSTHYRYTKSPQESKAGPDVWAGRRTITQTTASSRRSSSSRKGGRRTRMLGWRGRMRLRVKGCIWKGRWSRSGTRRRSRRRM
eukprot:5875378-Pyramimonas_sp.AAC.1